MIRNNSIYTVIKDTFTFFAERRLFLAIFLFICFAQMTFSQETTSLDTIEIERIEGKIREYNLNFNADSVKKYALDLVEIYQVDTAAYKEEICKAYVEIASSYFEGSQLDSVFHYNDLAEPFAFDATQRAKVYRMNGIAYQRRGDFIKARDSYELAKESVLQDTSTQKSKRILGVTFISLGALAGEMADFERAREFYNKAYLIGSTEMENGGSVMMPALINLATIHSKKEEFQKAYDVTSMAEELFLELYGPNQPWYAIILTNQAANLMKLDRFEESKPLLEKAIALRTKLFGADNLETARSIKMVAYYHRLKDEYQASLDILNKLDTIYANFPDQIAPRAENFYLKSPIYEALGDYDNERKAILTSLDLLEFEMVKEQDVSELKSPNFVIGNLQFLTKNYLRSYEDDQNAIHLDSALLVSEISNELLLNMKSNFLDKESLELFYKLYFNSHFYFVDARLHKFEQTKDEEYLKKAFDLMLQTKAYSMNKKFNKDNKLKDIRIDPTLLESEDSIYFSNLYLKNELANAQAAEVVDTQKINMLSENIFDNDLALEDLSKTLENDYPSYFKLNRKPDFSNIDDIKAELGQNQLLIEYFMDEDQIYMFLVTKGQTDYRKIKLDTTKQSRLKELVSSIQSEDFIEAQQSELADLILPSDVLEQFTDAKELIIVPDGLLYRIPFEIFKYNSSNNLLVEKYAISYRQSSSFIGNKIIKQKKYSEIFAAFAPSYTKDQLALANSEMNKNSGLTRSTLLDLPGALSEASMINELVNGKLYLNNEASKEIFLRDAAKFKVLHLAMHAIENPGQPLQSELMFSSISDTTESRLNAYELMQTDLSADMVVLSACNTGTGKFTLGEGIQSLAYAFTYSGVPSTVMSLWKVPDDATSKIMLGFYQYLKDGKTKNEALQLAKLDYLKDDTIPESQKTPYYWAGFIATGDMSPIPFNQSNLLYFGIAIAFILGLAGLLLKKDGAPM